MAFRADESATRGFEYLKNYFISRDIEVSERERSINKLHDIVQKYGPVVDSYPSWHPLVTNHDERGSPATTPDYDRCGYEGLDHTRYFLNAFITCPYGDGQEVIDSVDNLPAIAGATITAEYLNIQLYQPGTTPILVSCN